LISFAWGGNFHVKPPLLELKDGYHLEIIVIIGIIIIGITHPLWSLFLLLTIPLRRHTFCQHIFSAAAATALAPLE